MSYAFVIKGLVRERDSRIGLPDLIVGAYDKDLKYDDLMGEARTGCDGSFCIVSRVRCRARSGTPARPCAGTRATSNRGGPNPKPKQRS